MTSDLKSVLTSTCTAEIPLSRGGNACPEVTSGPTTTLIEKNET
jgi:hypothetical protein